MDNETYKAILIEQVNSLIDWNRKHINDEPEQVRKNIETIEQVSYKLLCLDRRLFDF